MSKSDLSVISEAPTNSDRPTVMQTAFVVGWLFAELYDRPSLPSPRALDPDAPVPEHLPGASEMSNHDRACVTLDQARTATAALARQLKVELPILNKIAAVLNRPGHHRDEVRREILSIYLLVYNRVAGVSPLAAISCGLGRLLADTVLLPTSRHTDVLRERFYPSRLANAYRWLDDLSTSFPDESAAAVKASLRSWAKWTAQIPKDQGACTSGAVDGNVIRRLREQGEIWRRLIAGEINPRALLSPEDYVAAGEALMQRGREMVRHFLMKWWPGVLGIVVVTGAAVLMAIMYAPAGSARVTAVLVSLVGSLGVIWKSVGATLGKALSQAEASLWNSEVVVAIGRAATVPPTPVKRDRYGDQVAGADEPTLDSHTPDASPSSSPQQSTK